MADADFGNSGIAGKRADAPSAEALEAAAAALLGKPEYTPLDVAARSGVAIERLRRLWRALGFPPVPDHERVFTDADISVVALIGRTNAEAWLQDQGVIQVARVLGQAMARVAETEVGLVGSRLGPAGLVRDFAVLERIEPFLGYVWRRHVVSALGRQLPIDGDGPAGQRSLVVGFADLVGFTTLSRGIDGDGLARVVDRFEVLAYEHIPERSGRVIKMVGDEVMFVADTATAAAAIAIGLVESHAADPIVPNIRVGLAFGPVVPWEGDLFGPTVNLASRLVEYAKPATVLVDENVAQALEGAPGLRVKRLRRPVRLKGFDKVTVAALSRPATESAPAAGLEGIEGPS